MLFVSCSHFIHFCMLYYENKDTSGTLANMYIFIMTQYSNNKAALAIHFSILHSCDQERYTQPVWSGTVCTTFWEQQSSNQVLFIRPYFYVSTRSGLESTKLLIWREGTYCCLISRWVHWVSVGVSWLCEKKIKHACFEVANWEEGI